MGAEQVDNIFADGARLLKGKKTLGAASGVTEAALESLYAFCFHEFQAGKIEDAAKTFELLCLYNHENPDYWLGLGACREKQRDFGGAASALYMALTYQQSGGGETRVRIAENLQASGDVEGARDFAKEALASDLEESYRNRAESVMGRSSESS